MSEKKGYRIEAVVRALTVLEALGEHPDQGVTALATRLGLTKSIVFRLLNTLESQGFVQRDPQSGTFSLGAKMAILGDRVGRNGALMHVAPPVMDRLRDVTGENVNLVVREGVNSHVLATREGYHSIRLFAQSGRRGPLHAGGASLILLAHAEPAVQDRVLSRPLEQFTPYTVTEPDRLRDIFRRIQRNGYNVALNDLDEGAFSVSAPIRDGRGEVVAGISVAGAAIRLDESRRAQYLEAVQKAAAEISSGLGLG